MTATSLLDISIAFLVLASIALLVVLAVYLLVEACRDEIYSRKVEAEMRESGETPRLF